MDYNLTEKCKGELESEVVQETRRNGRRDLGKDRGGKAEVGGLHKFDEAVITIARSPRYVLQEELASSRATIVTIHIPEPEPNNDGAFLHNRTFVTVTRSDVMFHDCGQEGF